MAKNLIPEIAHMLGVEIGEEFKIKGREGAIYKFIVDGLLVSDDDAEKVYTATHVPLVGLVRGDIEIVKLPWKPTLNKGYWTFTVRDFLESSPRTWTIRPGIWENHPIDIALLNKGWAFRTREEAEDALPKVAAEFDVKYRL